VAWVRIHDGAMTHPKIVGLVDWNNPFCVWVWGLTYAQLHLTDGLIPTAAVPHPKAKRAIEKLVVAGCWTPIESVGWKIHDYLDWNDSRETVLAKREGARNALHKHRAKHISSSTTEMPLKDISLPTSEMALARSGVVLQGISSSLEGERERKPDARSKRPIFTGQRFVVFEWMFDDLMRMLGPHGEAFNLHEWFFELDAKAVEIGQVIPARDGGQWLQAQTLAEAKRRGLPIAVAVPPEQRLGKQTTRLMAALANLSDERPA
jgi:hypothetical protein